MQAIPAMQLHRARGLARVKLNGRDHYLGKYGSPEAQSAYDELIRRWLANRRRPLGNSNAPRTVDELGDAYVAHAETYYVKNGRPTRTVGLIQRALELLYAAGLAQCPVRDFTPWMLRRFQGWLAEDQAQTFSRKTINEYTRLVRSMFAWGVAEGFVPGDVYQDLATVPGLRRGRPAPGTTAIPRSSRKVEPVEPEHIRLALSKMRPAIAAMVRVQLLTGMRPGAVVMLRPRDIRRTQDRRVMAYVVPHEVYKLDHVGDSTDDDRTVFIGPRAWSILKPLLPDDPDEFIFSPRRSEEQRNAARRRARKTPRWESHEPSLRRERRGQREAGWGEHYTVGSYRRAIQRACRAAGVPEFRPHRLRHNAASSLASAVGVDVAQKLLGHSNITTTMIYNKVAARRAIAAARKLG